MTLSEIDAYLRQDFAQVFTTQALTLEVAEGGVARLRLSPDTQHLRPGGIISGPTMMMLADAAAYAALLSLSESAKMAVTTTLNINFLRAATPGPDILQEATVLKPGRRLSVIECEARQPRGSVLAHATMTYAMPAER